MGRNQTYRGDPENKLFYIVDHLIGGVNTDFSDDTSPDNEFESLINFDMDRRGSLHKRLGFGKLNAVSQIFDMFEEMPVLKVITPEDPTPHFTNDNVVYMKLLRNDNNCFRVLSGFTGEKAYRQYQDLYGSQYNCFELLMVTSNKSDGISRAWYFMCQLGPNKDQGGKYDTLNMEQRCVELPVKFDWKHNLTNIDTIEFFDKIYLTNNDTCLVCYDRSTNSFSYSADLPGVTDTTYKPSPMEIRKTGFNVVAKDPLHWVDYKGISTASIQGVYLTTDKNVPLNIIPSGGKFRLNVLYTGSGTLNLSFKEGETAIAANVTTNTSLSRTGLAVYDIVFTTTPTSEVEIKVENTSANIDPYYDYYSVGIVDPEAKVIEHLNLGEHKMCEMYNRAVYYKADTIWFSEINNFNYVPNYNYVSLPIEPTDEITKITFFKNVYIIFTKFRIYKMIGSFGASDFQVMPVNLSIGCHAPNTVVPVENELYFASPRGLYALKSSDFREGIENLKELDTKVKAITSNSTRYIADTVEKGMRYNGIPETAYAIRYKDKYMLFLNPVEEKGFENIKDIDALVYQYELGAFTQMKFAVRPTFLFMVDGAIETLCSIPQKEEYTETKTILEYDLTEKYEGDDDFDIEDKSGNGNHGYAVGSAITNGSSGVSLTSGEIKLASIPASINLTNGFDIKIKCALQNVKDGSIYGFSESHSEVSNTTKDFSITTDYKHGYALKANFTSVINPSTLKTTVSYSLYLLRQSTSISATNDGKYKLTDANGTALIGETSYNVTFSGSNLSYLLKTGSFTVSNNSDGSYSKNWTLNLNTYYTTTTPSTYWVLGAATSFSKTIPINWGAANLDGYLYIKLDGTATAYEGGATVKVTPTFGIKKNANLAIGERSFYTYIDGGTALASNLGKLTGTGPVTMTGPAVSKKISYSGGTKTISIDGYLDFRGSFGGNYKTNIEISEFDFTLPSVKQETKTTTTKTYENNSKTSGVSFSLSYKTINNSISFNIVNSSLLSLNYVSSSNSYTYEEDLYDSGEYINDKHDFVISHRVVNGSWLVILTDNGGEVLRFTMPYNCIENVLRDNNYILGVGPCVLYDFGITNNSGKAYVDFDIPSSSGTTVKDVSGNNIYGTINGTGTIVTEAGTMFDGKTGYIKLPTFDDTIRFSDGFVVEFEARLDKEATGLSKIIDFATTYDTTKSPTNNCSIGIGASVVNKLLSLDSYSATGKTYKLSGNNLDLTQRHKWKFEVKDNLKEYDISLYCDGVLVVTDKYNYGGITNITRKSNFIGKSNNPSESLFKGVLYNIKITIAASANAIPIYESAMYEYDTTYDDFGRTMDIELITKGMNLKHAMHNKKLKHVFVKGLGGYNYNEMYFELYVDGHLVNDPKVFNCYIDEFTKQVVYDYTSNKALSFNEMASILGNMRLGTTKLGQTDYETKKLIVPSKGKNFAIKIYGESSDSLSIDSIGFTYKLGKVKE